MSDASVMQGVRSPSRLEEALAWVAQAACLPLAGGTDIYPARVGRVIERPLLDLSRLEALRGVAEWVDAEGGRWLRIGALETWSALRRAALPVGCEALAQAAAEVGGVQIQNQGTIGGNLCNASPAADGVPVLLALDAQVELCSLRGTRRLPLEQFVLGNRKTALAADELLTAIHLPLGSARARSQFLKLGHRRYLVISIAMVAVRLDFDAQDRVSSCAIAIGACSAVAQRQPALERLLLDRPRSQLESLIDAALSAAAGASAPPSQLSGLSPLDDVRGSAAYRLEVAGELVRRALLEVVLAGAAPTFAQGDRS